MNRYEKGITLPITLVLLLVLLLGTLSSANFNKVASKISGRDSDRNTALESGEAALRYIESTILTPLLVTNTFNGTNGRYGTNDIEPDPLLSASYSLSVPATTAKVSAPPRYFIKYMGDYIPPEGIINLGGYGANLSGQLISVFRITVMAQGQDPSTRVILQSYFEKRF